MAVVYTGEIHSRSKRQPLQQAMAVGAVVECAMMHSMDEQAHTDLHRRLLKRYVHGAYVSTTTCASLPWFCNTKQPAACNGRISSLCTSQLLVHRKRTVLRPGLHCRNATMRSDRHASSPCPNDATVREDHGHGRPRTLARAFRSIRLQGPGPRFEDGSVSSVDAVRVVLPAIVKDWRCARWLSGRRTRR